MCQQGLGELNGVSLRVVPLRVVPLWYLGGYINASYQNFKIGLKHLFLAKKASLFLKNADFFQYKNTPSFIKTMTLDEREHTF